MLSRVADSLYWMSRYLERAEHTARALHVQLDIALDEAPWSATVGWVCLLGGLRADLPIEVCADPRAVTQAILLNRASPLSVVSSIGAARENVTLHALDVRTSHGEDIEALSVIAEHGAYAFIGRAEGGVVRGLHAADPLFADLLAERLGRAAGLRIFT